MLSTGAAFYRLREGLSTIYDREEATAIAHEAMQHLTGMSKLERLSRKDELLDAESSERFMRMETDLIKGMPFQYITGIAWFLGREFSVNNAVLIPRPETEELAEWIIADERPQNIIDIGTGSGCIAISLTLAMPETAVTAIDVSPGALAVAQENAERLKGEVDFKLLDFLDTEKQNGLPVFDLIVSNPPYIPETERETLHTNVRDHEPAAALFVPGHDALQFYRAIAGFGKTHLTRGGSIYCELHRDYATDTVTLFKEYGYSDVLLKNDMHGAPRMLRARRM
jgi:release factor glutamine methyltransferase